MRSSESAALVWLVCGVIAFWIVNVRLGEGGCARIIPGSLALIVLCLGSLAFKRWRSATICLITMIGCIWYREITAPRWNGSADRDARLTIHGRDLRAQDQIAVAWVPAFVGDSKEIAWKPADSRDGSGQEFTSRAQLTVYDTPSCIRPHTAWTFYGQIPILIRYRGKEFAFLPEDIFGPPRLGPTPQEFTASINIDDYLDGSKQSRAFDEIDLRRVAEAKKAAR